jgi:hypothetical protein
MMNKLRMKGKGKGTHTVMAAEKEKKNTQILQKLVLVTAPTFWKRAFRGFFPWTKHNSQHTVYVDALPPVVKKKVPVPIFGY